MENSATLICGLPCFSPTLQCVLSHFITNCTDVNVANTTSDIIGSVMSYTYPTQSIILSGLNSGTTYNYCVVAVDSSMMMVGEPLCGTFTTQMIISKSNDGKYN